MGFLGEITGCEQITGNLLYSIQHGRVSHAYLLAGPEGSGKEALARALAIALLCSAPAKGDACGYCRSCRQAENHNHPDLHYIQPAGSSIKIEQIRSVLRRASFRSYQGGRQVFLIKQAEAMTVEAANCLLKTLEEPARDTVFILLAARPQALLPTVLSRCQQHCLTLAGQGRPEAAGGRREQAGLDAGTLLRDVLNMAGPAEALEMAGQLSESREKAGAALNILAIWYRDLLVWRESEDKSLLYSPEDRLESIINKAGTFETGHLLEIIKQIDITKNKILSNANVKLALEALFLRLTRKIEQ